MTTLEATNGVLANAKAATVLQRSVCLVLNCRSLGNHRQVDLDDIEMTKEGEAFKDAEKREITARKTLVASDKLAACRHVLAGAKAYLRTVSTSAHRVFGPGTYLVPVALLVEADTRLKQFKADLRARADELAAEWETIVTDRKQTLGPLFDAREFATTAEVRSAYAIAWSYVRFDAPNLVGVDAGINEQAQSDFAARCDAAFDEIVSDLRGGALTVFQELADRLSAGKEGKPKALRATALDDLLGFAALLPKRNIGGDDKLDAIVARVAAFSRGLDVETLKKAPAVREQLKALAEEAAGALDGLIQESSGRAIRLRAAS